MVGFLLLYNLSVIILIYQQTISTNYISLKEEGSSGCEMVSPWLPNTWIFNHYLIINTFAGFGFDSVLNFHITNELYSSPSLNDSGIEFDSASSIYIEMYVPVAKIKITYRGLSARLQ